MSLHKLTAGDGYTYLTRQVAAHDSTERGRTSLGEYYDEKGEAPGRWMGTGLAGLGMAVGEAVCEKQMVSLFGFGRHPHAAVLEAAAISAGGSAAQAVAAGALGRLFNIYPATTSFQAAVGREFGSYNSARGERSNAAIPAVVRATIRTTVATRLFAEQDGREPADARELSGFIARASRPATSARPKKQSPVSRRRIRRRPAQPDPTGDPEPLGRDRYWHGRVTIGTTDDGRPDRRHVMSKTKAKVLKRVKALEQARDSGTVRRAGQDWTVEQWLTHWVETIARPFVRENTLAGYRVAVNKHLIPGVGQHRLSTLRPEHLEKLETDETKSRAGRRVVGLPDALCHLLREHRAHQAQERLRAGQLWRDGGWLFATEVGEPINPRTDWTERKRLLKRAGIRDGRLHDARHTAATMLLILGVSERTIMGVMGWSNTAMTHRYAHMVDPSRDDVARQIGRLLWATPDATEESK